MSDSRTLAERIAECCPSHYFNLAKPPQHLHCCKCDGCDKKPAPFNLEHHTDVDGYGAWRGHALAAEVGEMDTALRTTQKWLRASRERAEAAEALLTEAPNTGYGQNAQRWTDEEY